MCIRDRRTAGREERKAQSQAWAGDELVVGERRRTAREAAEPLPRPTAQLSCAPAPCQQP
eukprot:5911529-Alexandrium_andersonii.AAC.1